MLKTKQRFSSKITQKGQATIPIFIRQFLHVNPTEEIEFIIDNNSVSLQKKEQKSDNESLAYSFLLSDEWDSEADNLAYNDL